MAETKKGERGRAAGLLAEWTGLVARRALLIVAIALASALGALVYAAGHLGINTNTIDMISPDLPFQRAYQDYQKSFPQFVDALLIVIDAETPERAEQAVDSLASRLAERPDMFQDVYQPGGGEFFESRGLLFQSPEELETLADNLARAQPLLARLGRDRSLRGLFSLLGEAMDPALDAPDLDLAPILGKINTTLEANLAGKRHPISWRALMSGSESSIADRRRILLARPYLNYAKLLPAEPAMDLVRSMAQKLQADGVRVRITGDVALGYEELQAVSQGMRFAGVASLILVGMVLWMGLRSFRLVAATLATLMAGLSLTAGFAALAVGHLNMISVAFAVLYVGLGVDYAIHLCLRYQELIGLGHPRSDALTQSAADVGPALVLCALTTAIGFYAFIPTDYSGVSELGLISGTGMLIALLISITLLPAWLTLWPPPRHERPPRSWLARRTTALFDWPVTHGRAIRWISIILGLASCALLPRIRFDYNPINLRDPQSESVSTFRELISGENGSPLAITVLAPDEKTAADYADAIGALSSVDKVVSIHDFVPADQEEKLDLIDDCKLILGPESHSPSTTPKPAPKDRIASVRAFLKVLEGYASEPSGSARAVAGELHFNLKKFLGIVSQDKSAEGEELLARVEGDLLDTLPIALSRLRMALTATGFGIEDLPPALSRHWLSAGHVYRLQVVPRHPLSDNAALAQFVSQVRSVASDATDEPVLRLESGDAIVGAFKQAFLGAALAIAILLVAVFRNLADPLCVLLPLLFAGALTGAATVVIGMPFNFANVIALPLLLGLGVDNGIHIVQRVRRMGRLDSTLIHSSTSRGIVFTCLTTICSFGTLALIDHPGTASMGLLLTVGILLTLMTVLVVLPAFLMRNAPGGEP